MITCYDSNGNIIKTLYQWDTNRIITLRGEDFSDVIEVHLTNEICGTATTVLPLSGDAVLLGNNALSFTVPNVLLQTAKPLIIYLYRNTPADEDMTSGEVRIPVRPRARPTDYVDEEAEREAAELQRQQNELLRIANENARRAAEEARVAAEQSRVNAEIARQAKEDERIAAELIRIANEQERVAHGTLYIATYGETTYAEISNAITDHKGVMVRRTRTVADLTVVDEGLLSKNSSDMGYKFFGYPYCYTVTPENVWSVAIIMDENPTEGSENLLSSGTMFRILDTKQDAEAGKGLSTHDYTDEDKAKVDAIPTKTSDLINDATFQTEDEVDQKINDAIASGVKFEAKKVAELPEVGEGHIIYLVPNADNPNVSDEYIWVAEDPVGHFEPIGSTAVDLSDYYTKDEADAILNEKANLSDLPTQVSELENDSGYQTAPQVATYVGGRLADYYTSAETADLLNRKANGATTLGGYHITDAYTKEEIDSMVSAAYRYAGSVNALSELPATANVGDVIYVEENQLSYAWNGAIWSPTSALGDLSKIKLEANNMRAVMPSNKLSGATVTFNDGANDLYFDEVKLDIVTKQAGSGTPSPTNVRPLSGYTSANIFVSPDNKEETAYVTTVDFPDGLGTIYRGTLNVTTGRLEVTAAYMKLVGDGTEGISVYSAPRFKVRAPGFVAAARAAQMSIQANCLATYPLSQTGSQHRISQGDVNTDYIVFNLGSSVTSVELANQWLATHNLEIVYPLAAPKVYYLTPTQVKVLMGRNYVWADTGAINVSYLRNITDMTAVQDAVVANAPFVAKWAQGGVSGDGTRLLDNANRIRTVWIDGTDASYTISVKSVQYEYNVCYYSQRELGTLAYTQGYTNEPRVTASGYWMLVLIRRVDDANITPNIGDEQVIFEKHSVTSPRNWNGLRVSMLGDSISTMQGYIPPENITYYTGSNYGVSDVNQLWWYQAIVGAGAKPLIMDAWSGTTIAAGVRPPISGNARIPMSDTSRCQRLHSYIPATSADYDLIVTADNISTLRVSPFDTPYTPSIGDYVKRVNPDVILMTGGGNDYSYDAPMGTWDGHEPLDASAFNTFREAYANTLNLIRAEYPDALVVCCIPFFFIRPAAAKEQVNINNLGLTYHDYHKAIREIAELTACPVVDLFAVGFNRWNYYPTYAQDSSDNPTHPNRAGHTVIGKSVAPQLSALCNGYIWQLKQSKLG